MWSIVAYVINCLPRTTVNDWCHVVCSHVTVEVDRGMSWDQATSRLQSNPGRDLNGFYVSRRENQTQHGAGGGGRRWYLLATLKEASTHVFRIARLETLTVIASSLGNNSKHSLGTNSKHSL